MDDYVSPFHGEKTKAPGRATGADQLRPIVATPYRWPDPALIPQRRFLFGQHASRGFVSLTVAAGGTGKTALALTEALAVASGRDRLNQGIREPGAVWYLGLEDPLEEYERRLAAAALHYGIGPDDLQCGLYLDSGREQDFVIVREVRAGLEILEPVVAAIIANVRRHSIRLIIVDPFIGCHAVGESDNVKIEKVARQWARIAQETDCAVELIHHVKKGTAGQEASADDSRGATALVNAARSVRVLSPMSKDEASRANVLERRRFFKVGAVKSNLSLVSDEATWRQMVSVPLGNGQPGDTIGVVEPWKFPSVLEGLSPSDLLAVQRRVSQGQWRESAQAQDWVGRPIAEVLDLDVDEDVDKKRVKAAIKIWIKSGALRVVERPDKSRQPRNFVEVGEWAT